MNTEIILSIYIATYNREKVILKKIQQLLNINSNEFNIWILDDCSLDGTYESLSKISDTRLNLIRNENRQGNLSNGAMPNWFKLAECCDGKFCLHLNDRDEINSDGLVKLICFLKKNPYVSGGICTLRKGFKVYDSPKNSFIHIPYKGIHPTGIIYNTSLFKNIKDRDKIYTKDISYIHPHDLILGELSKNGKMFKFEKIWNYANQESFRNNKSFLYRKGSLKSSWFSPSERLKEFELFLKSMKNQGFSSIVFKKKCIKVARCYLYFCTFNYAYYISDIGQTEHYGIEPKILTKKELIEEKNIFIEKSFSIIKAYSYNSKYLMYSFEMNTYFYIIYGLLPVWKFLKAHL